MCNPDSQGNDNILYSLGLECAQSWLKIGQLSLETSGQIYPYLLVAAAHYAPDKYVCYIVRMMNIIKLNCMAIKKIIR